MVLFKNDKCIIAKVWWPFYQADLQHSRNLESPVSVRFPWGVYTLSKMLKWHKIRCIHILIWFIVFKFSVHDGLLFVLFVMIRKKWTSASYKMFDYNFKLTFINVYWFWIFTCKTWKLHKKQLKPGFLEFILKTNLPIVILCWKLSVWSTAYWFWFLQHSCERHFSSRSCIVYNVECCLRTTALRFIRVVIPTCLREVFKMYDLYDLLVRPFLIRNRFESCMIFFSVLDFCFMESAFWSFCCWLEVLVLFVFYLSRIKYWDVLTKNSNVMTNYYMHYTLKHKFTIL